MSIVSSCHSCRAGISNHLPIVHPTRHQDYIHPTRPVPQDTPLVRESLIPPIFTFLAISHPLSPWPNCSKQSTVGLRPDWGFLYIRHACISSRHKDSTKLIAALLPSRFDLHARSPETPIPTRDNLYVCVLCAEIAQRFVIHHYPNQTKALAGHSLIRLNPPTSPCRNSSELPAVLFLLFSSFKIHLALCRFVPRLWDLGCVPVPLTCS